jgi:hypothetical protein
MEGLCFCICKKKLRKVQLTYLNLTEHLLGQNSRSFTILTRFILLSIIRDQKDWKSTTTTKMYPQVKEAAGKRLPVLGVSKKPMRFQRESIGSNHMPGSFGQKRGG